MFAKKYNNSLWNDSHFFTFKEKFLLKSLGQKVESFKRHIRREAEDRELARLIFMRKKKKSRIFRIRYNMQDVEKPGEELKIQATGLQAKSL